MNTHHKQVFGPAINRIPDLMAHIDRYSFHGVERLAEDAGIGSSSVARLIRNEGSPFFFTVVKLTEALERHVGQHIDPRDLIAKDGRFLHRYLCDLVGCRGCLPEAATDKFGDLRQAFVGIEPGCWVSSRYPRGFESLIGGRHDH